MERAVTTGEAIGIIISSVRTVEPERAGVINTPGRTLAEDVLASGSDEVLVSRGALIGGAEMGLLAAAGRHGVMISRRPRVSIITTGDEVVDLMETLEAGQTRNTNRYSLVGRILSSGCEIGRLLHSESSPAAVRSALQSTRARDAVIVVGSPSVESSDLLDDIGEVGFRGIGASPLNTLAFVLAGCTPVFLLPGREVAADIGFELVVRPALLAVLGRRQLNHPVVQARAVHPIAGMTAMPLYVPSVVFAEDSRLCVTAVGMESRAGLAHANGISLIPGDTGTVNEGDMVDVVLLGPLSG